MDKKTEKYVPTKGKLPPGFSKFQGLKGEERKKAIEQARIKKANELRAKMEDRGSDPRVVENDRKTTIGNLQSASLSLKAEAQAIKDNLELARLEAWDNDKVQAYASQVFDTLTKISESL